MKGYREIKRILVEEIGFRDRPAYKKWIDEDPHSKSSKSRSTSS